MCIAMHPLLLLGEYGHVIARVVGELVGVAGVERLGCTEHRRERLRVRLKESRIADVFHHAFGAVHSEDVGRLDHFVSADERLAVLVVVAVNRERKAFEKSAIHARWVAEVYWRTEDKYIRFARAFENGAQIIADGTYAVRLGVLELAGEAAFATGEAEVVEVYEFRFGSCLLCARFRRLEHLGSVPALTRAAVEEHSEWFVVACHCRILSFRATKDRRGRRGRWGYILATKSRRDRSGRLWGLATKSRRDRSVGARASKFS